MLMANGLGNGYKIKKIILLNLIKCNLDQILDEDELNKFGKN